MWKGSSILMNSSKNLTKDIKRLDCSIAMMHLELGVLHEDVEGSWQYLHGINIAKFIVNSQN